MSVTVVINNKIEEWEKLNNFLKEHYNSDKGESFLADYASIHVVVYNEPFDKTTYPINMVRNIAMKNAKSDWVFNVDIDFIPTFNGHMKAIQHKDFIIDTFMKTNKKSVFVVPAFETDKTRNMKLNDMKFSELKNTISAFLPRTKADLTSAIMNKEIELFHFRSFPKGHGPTNLTRWLEDFESYEIQYGDRFEPFLIMNRHHIPEYDEVFEGRYIKLNTNFFVYFEPWENVILLTFY